MLAGSLGASAAASAPTEATIAGAAATPVTVVEKLTGPDAPSNTWGRWDIKGTDLGIMWDNGQGEVLALLPSL